MKTLIIILFIWNSVGAFLLVVGTSISDGALRMAEGWEFVNPCHIHKYNYVNWFGAIIVALFYSALCPIGAIIYWFYKLCTVERTRD